jgi:hypothetical protein
MKRILAGLLFLGVYSFLQAAEIAPGAAVAAERRELQVRTGPQKRKREAEVGRPEAGMIPQGKRNVLWEDGSDDAGASASEGEEVMPHPHLNVDDARREARRIGSLRSDEECREFIDRLKALQDVYSADSCRYWFAKHYFHAGSLAYYDGRMDKISRLVERGEMGEESKEKERNNIIRDLDWIEKSLIIGKEGVVPSFFEAHKRRDLDRCQGLKTIFIEWTEWANSWKPAGRRFGERRRMCSGEGQNLRSILGKDWYSQKLEMLEEYIEDLRRKQLIEEVEATTRRIRELEEELGSSGSEESGSSASESVYL